MLDEIGEGATIDPGDLESEASKQASGAVDFADVELDSLSTAEQFDKLKKDAFTFITQDLSHKQLIVLGEGHNNDFTPLRLLIARMLPVMKDKGFDTLALEFDEMGFQSYIDKYLENGNPQDLKMPFVAAANFDDFLSILSVCRSEQIKVRCVDNTSKFPGQAHDNPYRQSYRDLQMFENLRSIGSKTICLVGNEHLYTEPTSQTSGGEVTRLGYLLRHSGPILTGLGTYLKKEWKVDHTLIRGVGSQNGVASPFALGTIKDAGIIIDKPCIVEPKGKFTQYKQRPDYLLVLPNPKK